MKKNFKKIIALLLSLLMLSLVACGEVEGDGETRETTGGNTESDTTPEDTVILGKTAEYYIAYSNGASFSIAKAAEALDGAMELATGLKYSIHSEKSGGKIYPEPVAEKEIFIGSSEREAYASVYDGLEYGEWRIKVINGSIVITGSNVSATLDAVDYFTANFVEGKKNIEIAADYEYKHEVSGYAVESIKLGGVDISEYSIVYKSGDSAALQAVNDLAFDIGTASGIVMPVRTASRGMDVSRAIVVGQTIDFTPTTENYGDSKVYVDGTTVYVEGKDIVGLERGITYLSELFTSQKNVDVAFDSISHEGVLQDRSVYVNDATAFVPCYDGRINTSAEKLPLSYKVTQLNKVAGEVLVIAHRGEHTYYPENSLEGAISAWRMGAVSTEFDIQKTKDGHWVAMHDNTVSRTTNVIEARAADSSLPTSDKVADWTLEQLRMLRLKDDYGSITPFPIPTLREALHACDGRIFLHLDKSFNYGDDILPVMLEENVVECVYICNNVPYSSISSVMDTVKNAFMQRYPEQYPTADSVRVHSLMRTSDTPSTGISNLKGYISQMESDDRLSPTGVFLGDFVKSSQTYNEQIRDTYSKQLRIATWVLRNEADYEFMWRKARSFNYSIFLTDYPYEFMQRIK